MLFISVNAFALKSDKEADFELLADNFINVPAVKNGLTQNKFWGHVFIQQGTLKIHADEAIVFKAQEEIDKVILTGTPVQMEQFIDAEYGKVNVTAKKIDFIMKDDLLLLSGDVVITSKIQGEMHGEKISMNLKTKVIKGVKSENNDTRVRLIIKSNKK